MLPGLFVLISFSQVVLTGICAKKAPVLCRSSPSAYFPIFGHVPSESERKSSPAEEKK